MANEAALSGIRVLELADGSAGGFCGKLFAGLGAEVIKSEPPEGDSLRHEGPFPGGRENLNASGAYLNINTGKRSVTIDIKTPEGQALIAKLAAKSDVVLESFEPGYLDSINLGYKALSANHPELIMVSVTPFGQTGPYAHYVANEMIVYAVSGYMSLAGDADREPHKAHGDQAGIHAGYQAALATMCALNARDTITGGKGQHVDVAQIEGAAFLTGGPPHTYILRGEIAVRSGTRLLGGRATNAYPSTLRPCKGGWIHAHSNTRYPEFMADLMGEELNAPHLLKEPHGNADEIDAIMDKWLAQYDKWEVVRLAQAKRLHFTEVMTPGEVLDDPAYEEREFWYRYELPGVGPIRQPGPVVRFAGTPWKNAPAPALGADNAEILAGV